ncbi:MAG: NAD(P)/FAD-dependent oxidoreductase [Bacteroidales bacterium]|jgi:all-trans-retinol 13,14-reductase|nr:NAD(P)/FAD-dependent oxidoreductase [Bacteroidales bacterium]MDD2204142.1 NAD(P)/FAD-dependent oxidoreductase [Bacteroidales bacterium]MDD3152151.1 NAD(P)/FAD-dependent oxidoreductase [Bacteroidales bacterium]MDD3913806.1 NAD(P)/FAD-dependent oxidoreductase [Bacteroidales bacterium]MDD4633571.1 NAD(P)/FAD-dependent oxidoreductase [Bacteroidales bacterium]
MAHNRYEIAILGTGLGGLICGYILSRKGYKVVILEKNHQIGGCLQTFKRFGVKFDTGMHYIGSLQEGQILHKLFDFINVLDDVKVHSLDTDGYDVISLAGQKYRYASGYEAFINTLSESFPENHKDIEEYIRRVRQIAASSPLYNMRKINTHTFIDADYIKTSVDEFIASVTSNPILQNILAGNLPLYAGVKGKTPTYIHALINNFYIQSAYRIVGGSDAIAQSLAKSIRSFGGEIYTDCEITNIICDDNKAVAVQLANGERIEADSFVSNIHPQKMLTMLDTRLIRKAYRDRINALENTISNFTVYIKFKENTTPYLNYNYYFYEDGNVWNVNNYDVNKYPQSYLYMHQCHKENPQYAQSAELIGYMKFDEVRQWVNTKVERRGEDYKTFKEMKAQQLLAKLEESFPGINSAIEGYETSSPLTYRDYTGTHEGSMYGIIRDKNFPTQTLVSQRTKIPNLFMTGQNINSHGILGVTIGAAITCAEFLGLNEIINEIDNE